MTTRVPTGFGAAGLLGSAALQLYKLATNSADNTCSPTRDAGSANVAFPLAKKLEIGPGEAQALMRAFTESDLLFDYPADASWVRAQKMCEVMEADGIECKKYWHGGDLTQAELQPADETGGPLYSAPGTGQPVAWRYHVAPLVKVRQPNGKLDDLVLDPTLGDVPLTKAQWRQRAGKSPTPIEATTATETHFPWPKEEGAIAGASVQSALQDFRDNRDVALGRPADAPVSQNAMLALVETITVQPEADLVTLERGLELTLNRLQPESAAERIVRRATSEKKRKIALKLAADGKTIAEAWWPVVDTILQVGKFDAASKKLPVALKQRPSLVFLSGMHPKSAELEKTLHSLQGAPARLAVDPATSMIEAVEAIETVKPA